MTDESRQKEAEQLAVDMALVLHWLVETVAPPRPAYVEKYLRDMMRMAETLSTPDDFLDRQPHP